MKNLDEYDIIKVPYWKLHIMCPVDDEKMLREVEESVNKVGILYPLVVRKITPRVWRRERLFHNPGMVEAPDHIPLDKEILMIQCGNNRYRAGLDAGVKQFDCIIVDSWREAVDICSKQRKVTKSWRDVTQ